MAPEPQAASLEAGTRALARGAWAMARLRFAEALAGEETPEAYEGLGTAARYQLDAAGAFDSHERGLELARAAGDIALAAKLAVQLAYDARVFRGAADARAWLERAATLVEGQPPSVASAFVPMLRAQLALLSDHDPESARELSKDAIALAQEVEAVDVEMLASALNGLAQVALGEVEAGLGQLDAATGAALGGEMTDVDATETVCCFMIEACRRLRDLERAGEWSERVLDFASRHDDHRMFSLCRTYFADVQLALGDWELADAELTAAAGELASIRPGLEGGALARLAELRRRQGRTTEAEQLIAAAEPHRLRGLVEGLLALDYDDTATALDSAARFLGQVGEADRFERVSGLELMVRAAIAADDDESVDSALAELADIATGDPSDALLGAAQLAAGRVRGARGQADEALARIEEAAQLFDSAGARYDAALARLELASALRLAGRESDADETEAQAQQALDELGAGPPSTQPGGLSAREVEVLRLLARGASNDDIARELALSVRTVERHTSNLYAKVGASGRTARASATAWALSHGIT